MTHLDLFDGRVQARQCYERVRILTRRYDQDDATALDEMKRLVQGVAVRANWQFFDPNSCFFMEPNEYALLIQDDTIQVRISGALLSYDTPVSACIEYRDAGAHWHSGELLDWTVLPSTDHDILEVFAAVVLRVYSRLVEGAASPAASQSCGTAVSTATFVSEAPRGPIE